MGLRIITDANGLFSCEIEVHGLVLEEAIEHPSAEDVLKCAVIVALSALAQDTPWPDALLDSMSAFMIDLRDVVREESLS